MKKWDSSCCRTWRDWSRKSLYMAITGVSSGSRGRWMNTPALNSGATQLPATLSLPQTLQAGQHYLFVKGYSYGSAISVGFAGCWPGFPDGFSSSRIVLILPI